MHLVFLFFFIRATVAEIWGVRIRIRIFVTRRGERRGIAYSSSWISSGLTNWEDMMTKVKAPSLLPNLQYLVALLQYV